MTRSRGGGDEQTSPPDVLSPSTSTAGEDDDEPRSGGTIASAASAASSLAGTVGSAAVTAASVAAGSVGAVARPIIHEVEDLASGAKRRIEARGRSPRARRRLDASIPLPLLYDVHPDARRAAPREIGLKIVPIDQIKGTAVEGAAQRGSDFLPLKPRRGADWEARFRRIQAALERLETLPPVELVRFGDGYWVVDGHNRIGAGLQLGQVAVDATVTDLRLPGAGGATTRIAPFLEGSGDLRAAGTGRRRSTSLGRESVEPSRLAAGRRAVHQAEHDDAVSARDRAVRDQDAVAPDIPAGDSEPHPGAGPSKRSPSDRSRREPTS